MKRISYFLLLAAIAVSWSAPASDVAAAQQPPGARLRIALVGQALIHADLRRVAPLAVAQAKEYLDGADVKFTNLETAVAPKEMALPRRTPDLHPTEPDVLDALKEMGFNMLSLANNHAWDLGVKGLLVGREEVAKRGFAYGPMAHSIRTRRPEFSEQCAKRRGGLAMSSSISTRIFGARRPALKRRQSATSV